MLKIPSLAPKRPSPFADKFEEDAFWQLHKKNGGGYINMVDVRRVAATLRTQIVIPPTIILPPMIRIPKIL